MFVHMWNYIRAYSMSPALSLALLFILIFPHSVRC